MLRHESLVHDDVFAAGPRQSADKPVVLDLDIVDRQQKKRALMGRRAAQRRDLGAEPDPARMIAAAGERPLAAQHIAAIGRHRGAGRGKTGAGERVVSAAPQFTLCLDREMAERNPIGEGSVERPTG